MRYLVTGVRHSLADLQEAARVLGYKPRVRSREGMAATVEWFSRVLVP